MLLDAAHGEKPLVAGELGLDDQTQGRPRQQGARACADLHNAGLYLYETQFGWWQPSRPRIIFIQNSV